MDFRLYDKIKNTYCNLKHNYLIDQRGKVWDWVGPNGKWTGEIEIEPSAPILCIGVNLELKVENSMYIIERNSYVLDQKKRPIFEGDIVKFTVKIDALKSKKTLTGEVFYAPQYGAWSIKVRTHLRQITRSKKESDKAFTEGIKPKAKMEYYLSKRLEPSMTTIPIIIGQIKH